MRLTAIILLSACLAASAAGTAQGITLKLKNAPLERVFAEIKKQTGYSFVYNNNLVATAKKVDLQVSSAGIEEVLDKCFKDQPLSYKIIDKTIIVIAKEGDLSPAGGGGRRPGVDDLQLPPPIDIRGRIVNEKGEPVAASIQVKGTNKGTTTNDNGEFELKGVSDDAVLVISGVSIETFEWRVAGKTELVLNAKIKNVQGENVNIIVSTGYQDIPKERATGSFIKINNELLNRRVSSDILSRLQGVANGVLFNGTGLYPLDNVSIRGRSTISANKRPLIIVDNFPYTDDLNTINPNDVEAITILKDAAAASIWGAYSGNGVIVITTKKGRFNHPLQLQLNNSITISKKPNLFYDQQFLNAPDFIDVENFLFTKGFYDADLTNTSKPPISPVVEILTQLRAGAITQAQANEQIALLRELDIRNDYSKYFYRAAVNQQYSMNLSGGTDKLNYYLSSGYNRDLSNIVGNRSSRLSFNSVSIYRPIKNLEMTAGFTYTINNLESNGMTAISAGGKYSAIYPYAQLADRNGNALAVVKDYRSTFVQNSGVTGLLNWEYYPLRELANNDLSSNVSNNRVFAGLKYSLIRGLSVEVKYQYQKNISISRSLYNQSTYYARNLINSFSVVSGNNVTGRNIPVGGILSNLNNTSVANLGRAQINYTNTWAVHNVSVIGGLDINDALTNGFSTRVYGYDESIGTYGNVIYGTVFPQFPSGSSQISNGNSISQYTQDRFRSFFGNGAYTYKNKYTFSISSRLDQSNIFGVKTNQKGKPLWSIGGKWNIDKEKFYNEAWFSSLQFRVTYGFNGNLDKGTTAFPTALYINSGSLNNLPYADLRSSGNPQLKWEKTGIINLGIEFGIVKDVLSGSIEYYHKNGVDLLGTKLIPSSTGFTGIRGNFSSMKGNGVDLDLNASIKLNGLIWQSNLQFSYSTNKIIKNETQSFNQRVGYPVEGVYAYRWGGLNAFGDPLGYLADTLTTNYAAIISLGNADPALGYKYIGSAVPTRFGAFLNTITWKNISLSANIIYKGGYYFKRNSISYDALFNSGTGHNDFTKRWQRPGDEQKTDVPAMVYTNYPNFSLRGQFYRDAEILVEKGDQIRLQDINLSYRIDKANWKRLPFQFIQLYLYANNLGVISKANKQGIDPDFPTGFPSPPTLSFGVRTSL